jgi:hypothetical protein
MKLNIITVKRIPKAASAGVTFVPGIRQELNKRQILENRQTRTERASFVTEVPPYRNGIASRIAPISRMRRKSIKTANAPTMTTRTQTGRKLQKEAMHQTSVI